MIVYLHGFNSSPHSHKAQVLSAYMAERGLAAQYACPALPPLAGDAVAVVEALMARHPGERLCLLGSSLGGFYATHLAEKLALRAVLINPAVKPQRDLESYLGIQRNLYGGEEYELTRGHIDAWRRLDTPTIHPDRYLLLVETGDEVLDYREAVWKYTGCRQIVVEGGDHSLRSFSEHLPLILEFAGLARL